MGGNTSQPVSVSTAESAGNGLFTFLNCYYVSLPTVYIMPLFMLCAKRWSYSMSQTSQTMFMVTIKKVIMSFISKMKSQKCFVLIGHWASTISNVLGDTLATR